MIKFKLHIVYVIDGPWCIFIDKYKLVLHTLSIYNLPKSVCVCVCLAYARDIHIYTYMYMYMYVCMCVYENTRYLLELFPTCAEVWD